MKCSVGFLIARTFFRNIYPASSVHGGTLLFTDGTVQFFHVVVGAENPLHILNVFSDLSPDKCQVGSHNCTKNADCTDVKGSYACRCREGYTENGKACVDTNECASDLYKCDSNANCINTAGSYNCFCLVGYHGNGYTCADVDECTTGSHDCHRNAECINNEGSYDCLCLSGYTGNGRECYGTVIICVIS